MKRIPPRTLKRNEVKDEVVRYIVYFLAIIFKSPKTQLNSSSMKWIFKKNSNSKKPEILISLKPKLEILDKDSSLNSKK